MKLIVSKEDVKTILEALDDSNWNWEEVNIREGGRGHLTHPSFDAIQKNRRVMVKLIKQSGINIE